MAKKQPFTLENNFSKVMLKIEDKPYKVLNIIGAALVKEIKPTLSQYYTNRSGRLTKSFGYWARKNEKDLQIGFKQFYAPFVMSENREPIKAAVIKNKQFIEDSIAKALDEIRKE